MGWLLLGALALLALKGKSDISALPSGAQNAERVARQAKEIVDGKRDAFTDDGPPGPSAIPSASDLQDNSDEAAALKAIQAAKAKQKKADRKSGKSAPVAKKPAKKPAKPVAKRPASAKAEKPASPVATSVPPDSATSADSAPAATPPGFDSLKAFNSAPDVARHIANKGMNYSRKVLKAWQRVAGIAQDGIYGKGSYAALRHFVGDQAPKPLFNQGTETYPWSDKT